MSDNKKFEETLKKIGKLAGVGDDWYEIGEAEKGEDGDTRYAVYAKTDEIAKKVEKVFDRLIADSSSEKREVEH